MQVRCLLFCVTLMMTFEGPPRACPLQLKLVSGDMEDMASQQPQSGVSAAVAVVAKGTSTSTNNRQQLRCC